MIQAVPWKHVINFFGPSIVIMIVLNPSVEYGEPQILEPNIYIFGIRESKLSEILDKFLSVSFCTKLHFIIVALRFCIINIVYCSILVLILLCSIKITRCRSSKI